jgi:endonuclease YncB( thermonuclease family)
MWSRWIAATTLVVTACGVGAGTGHPNPEPGAVSVIRVIDGDSLLVETGTGRLEVRVVGVNAPDRGECHHEAARDRLEEIVENAVVTIAREGRDRFGRNLARVFVDGSDMALKMVRLGHGIAAPNAADPRSLLESEETAYRGRLGMWGGECRSSTRAWVGFDIAAGDVDPPGPDGDLLHAEKVVVANFGDQPADLSRWAIRDGSSRHRYHFTMGTVLAPGGRLEVASSSPGWVPGGVPVWSNSGDVAILLDDTGKVVDRWRYAISR